MTTVVEKYDATALGVSGGGAFYGLPDFPNISTALHALSVQIMALALVAHMTTLEHMYET